ncbi:hypothetical protein N2601_28905 (plasmid) [Rhizobium sp. CB3060]|nr:hypothetical protein [Rhizobium tropici]UWU25398.1 hypothetical protein N2601_28905 [Rhizobium tropici]
MLNGRIDWTTIGEASRIGDDITPELKKHLRRGVDAKPLFAEAIA